MGIRPHNKQDLISGGDKVALDELSEVMSPLLEEATTFPDDERPTPNVLRLLEENARLRALAIKLSNLLGDLPDPVG